MARISEEFASVKELLYEVLKNEPETRNSDTVLYVRCCERLGAKSLKDIEHIGLNMISVHKLRQVIQNKEGLYKPDLQVQFVRGQRQEEIRDYMREYVQQ